MSSLWLLDPDHYAMCGRCSGTGKASCSSCGGVGGHTETRYDYDSYGRSVSRRERVSCTSCSGTGYRLCSQCGGTGSQRKYTHTRSRSSSSDENDNLSNDELTDDEEPMDETLEGEDARKKEPLVKVDLIASYQEALAEAQQVKEQLLSEIWYSTTVNSSYKTSLWEWVQALDLESSNTSEALDTQIRQWEGQFPPYDNFISLLRMLSSISFRVSNYKWLSMNFGS